MHLRDYAESIVRATTLPDKLLAPSRGWVDDQPGSALRIMTPGRPDNLGIAEARAVKVPPITGMQDKSQRLRILHAFANHELQAAELFAWMILAFPDEPQSFRRGLLSILVEEQEHCQLYIDRIRALGGEFGDYPVTGHFWNRIADVESPLDFVCMMGLVFENANLDFGREYAIAARAVGDEETAVAIEKVHEDEIRHVAFAWRWLERWKPDDQSCWQTFVDTLKFPITPARARGASLDRASREKAGLDADFIDNLERAKAKRPNGKNR
jgi:uncharacterized ferritin-like protein (DUF455 family)